MKLYGRSGAINPDRVTYFLAEKGKLDTVEVVEFDLMKGEHKTDPEYRKINPLRRVPALELDDGTVITESRAICTYLEGVHPEPNLMGETPLERAQVEMWDRRIEMMFMMSVAAWFRHGTDIAKALEPEQFRDWAAFNEKQVPKIADMFEARLSESPFVAGDRFTNADITLFLTLGFARYVRFKAVEGRPALGKWFETVRGRAMMNAAPQK